MKAIHSEVACWTAKLRLAAWPWLLRRMSANEGAE